MRWFAYLSNGEVVAEADEPGAKSTWRLLMRRCEQDGLHLRNLCLVVNGIPSWCRPEAAGYWQASLAFATLGGGTAPGAGGCLQLHAKGVGWAEGELLFTIWAAPDGRIWREQPRPVAGQRQIIWAPPFRCGRGGAEEQIVVQDGRARRASDGGEVRVPEPAILAPRMGLAVEERD